jgi:hypothetical protein
MLYINILFECFVKNQTMIVEVIVYGYKGDDRSS